MIHFVLGGARSGKSRFAENLAADYEQQGQEVVYIATAAKHFEAEDGSLKMDVEMQQRIEHHLSQRPPHWLTVECPQTLANCLQTYDDSKYCILVDCLTLWTLNVLPDAQLTQSEKEAAGNSERLAKVETFQQAFLQQLKAQKSNVILVSNEIGLGVMPLGQLTRSYVDELGRLHQSVSQLADDVTFMVAGLPMSLKTSV